MNLKRVLATLTCCGAGLATTALAQKEQWLEYHTSSEGRGYRWMELSTNAPAGVALPKLEGRAYFVRWATPLDPSGGRWLCLDQTRKGGLCDRLYIDLNGNGRLDDDPPRKSSRSDQYNAFFEPVKLVFKGEDGPISYHLLLRFSQYESSRANLMAQAGGFYAGKVDFGGKRHQIELIDGNVNGVFNDHSATPWESDRVSLPDAKQGREPALGKYLEIDGQYFAFEVARDGAFVKVKKAEDLVLGKVTVPSTIDELTIFGDNGEFYRKPVKGEFTLPVGSYTPQSWSIERKDKQGSAWQLSGSGFPDRSKFKVATDKPARLKMGEPIRGDLTMNTPREQSSQVSFGMTFSGVGGERIDFMKGNQRPPGPKLMLASLDGTYRSTNTFEFG